MYSNFQFDVLMLYLNLIYIELL